MPALICPRCKVKLPVRTEAQPAASIQSGCTQCNGVIIGGDALVTFFDSKLAKWFWEICEGNDPTVSVRCPCCQKFMRPASIEVQSNMVELDGCVHCRVIWFDPNEMDAVFMESIDRAVSQEKLPESKFLDFEHKVRMFADQEVKSGRLLYLFCLTKAALS